jgi:uncharacterized membrane protein YkoI
MKIKVLAGSAMVIAFLGLGVLVGSVAGSVGVFAQTPSGSATSPAQAAATPTPGSTQSAPTSPDKGNSGSSSITAKITQQQAEQAALAASPGNTIDHTSLQNQNGTPVYDVDFTNGGGVLVNGDTGAVITVEAAGQDQGGHGGRGGHKGGADQAALAAQAKVTQQQAEQAALTASPGNTVDHSILQDQNGTIVWDVDFTNGGGVLVNAQTGAIVKTEAAGTDQGGHGGRGQAPSTAPTPQP